jgi:hypothetical protein
VQVALTPPYFNEFHQKLVLNQTFYVADGQRLVFEFKLPPPVADDGLAEILFSSASFGHATYRFRQGQPVLETSKSKTSMLAYTGSNLEISFKDFQQVEQLVPATHNMTVKLVGNSGLTLSTELRVSFEIS